MCYFRLWINRSPGRTCARELAEEGIRIAVINARWAKPLDEDMIVRLAKGTHRIVTMEDHMAAGGFGSAVVELLERRGLRNINVRVIGLPDKLIEHGTPTILKELYGLSSAHVKEVVRQLVEVEEGTVAQ